VGNDPVNGVDLFGFCKRCAEEHPIQAATQAPVAEKSWFAEHIGPIIGPPYIAIVGPLLGAVSYLAENGVHLVTQTLYGDDYQWGANGYDRHSNAELLKLERNGPVNYQDANGEQQLFSHMVVGVFCMAATAPLEGLGLADDLVRGASWLGRTSQTARTGAGIIKETCEFGKRVAKKSGKAVTKAAKRPVRAAKAALGLVEEVAKRPPQTGAGSFLGSADEAYAAIRASTDDVAAIAGHTGIKPANIQKVKDHLFNNTHLLDRYESVGVPGVMARFDSDAGIAAAWQRLSSGSGTAADMQLLRHEAAEAWFMRRNGPSYNAAHNAADALYPAPNLGN
jgi:hypothetical protein